MSKSSKHIIQRTDGALARRESDAVVELSEMLDQKISKTYLIECEAWYDKTIVFRIAEYDSSVAIETAQVTDKEVVLIHPHSAVIFLHPNGNIPKKLKITHRSPDGEEMSYYVPTLKIIDYPVDTIFEKKLLILLPFYLFRFANELNELEENAEKRKDIEDALTDINQRLEAFKKQGSINEYQKRITQELLLRVSERLMVGYENIKKEVNEIMSGALARTKADEILEQGMAQGKNVASHLYGFLAQHGRYEDIIKASTNSDYFEELLSTCQKNGDIV